MNRRGVHAEASLVPAFTLAESLIASVVLAVAVVAVSGAIIASQQQTTASQEDMIAVSLARQLAEEVASRPLTTDATAGWPTVTDYTQYDTINDFAGYTDKVSASIYNTSTLTATGTFSNARPAATAVTTGTPTLARGEYSRVVSVTYPTSIFGKSVAAGDFTAGDFAIVTVTVRGYNGAVATLSRLQSKISVTR